MPIFHIFVERETDTDTTIRLESTQDAETMEDALIAASNGVGARLAYLLDTRDDLTIWIDVPGHTMRRYVTICPECGGNGVGDPMLCALCRGVGCVDAKE